MIGREYFWRNDDPLWYKDAIIYEVHPRAFFDSDGDGVGDFAGLTEKLDYLQDLGVTAIWLLPFYKSPLKDDGYDISEYASILPTYGTMRDFKIFMGEANYRGLRVITELVLNHTSDQHPWFQRARREPPGSAWRNFYVWSDTQDRYKEARIIFKDFEVSNWTWDPVARAYYWHRFYSHQPDINFDSAVVRRSIMRVLNFWLNMGVSGLRLDAVPYLYEREGTNCENLAETHAFLKELRRQVDGRFANRMLLAEANQWPEEAVAYAGQGDECHMAYHFPLMPRMFMAIRMEDSFPIIDILQQTPPMPESCQWALFLRNHDELTLEMVTDEERDYMYRVYVHDPQARLNLGIRRRLAPLLNNDRNKIELMNGLLFSLPGSPIIYYGDEIGMGDNFYLGDRNGVRTPMQWSPDRNAGFSVANPQRLYLPVNIDPEYHYEAVNVETQQNNPDSLLWWMKRLIAVRKRYQAFGRGSLEFLYPENRKVLAFLRRYRDETILVVANLSRLAQHVSLNLSEFSGKVPVEVFGQTEFCPVRDSAYFLTLTPYAFFWFSLESRPVASVGFYTTPAEVTAPTLVVSKDWRDLFRRESQPMLEAALLGYIRQRRWFGGKARHVQSVEITDTIAIQEDNVAAYLIIIRVEYSEGEDETYLLPVTCASGEKGARIASELPQAVVAHMEWRTKEALGHGPTMLYDALADKDFCLWLLRAMSRRRKFKGEYGEIVTSRTSMFGKLYSPDISLEPSLLKGEQTNTSVNYGDRFILKVFRRLEEGLSPELEIGRFLTQRNFTNAPRLVGAFEYRRRQKTEPTTLAILHEYVWNEGDAWRYTLDAVNHYFERVLALPVSSVPLPANKSLLALANEPLPAVAEETIGPYLASARLLGHRTGELHVALASSVDDPDFTAEPFTMAYQRSLFHSMRGFAVQVLQVLRNGLEKLPESARQDAQRVLKLEDVIIGRFQKIPRHKIRAMRMRCHGDYHLGQVLYTGNNFIIIDFEGEPAKHMGERRIKRSPLRDVAGMIRSFHYAANANLLGYGGTTLRTEDLPVLQEWAKAWYWWVSAIFLKAYLETMSCTSLLPVVTEDQKSLLDAYLMEKTLYEVKYEMNSRPAWVRLPLQGILQVLEAVDDSLVRAEEASRLPAGARKVEPAPASMAPGAGGGPKPKETETQARPSDRVVDRA